MKRSALFLALAAGFLVLGLGARDARAGLVPLPTTLDAFVDSGGSSNGNFTEVTNNLPPSPYGPEHLRFSQFEYTQATGDPPAAGNVHMAALTLGGVPGETGIRFTGAFNAPIGVTSDWVISYRVDELTPGAFLTDAYLRIVGGVNGGTGTINVSETITDLQGNLIGTLEAFNGHVIDTIDFSKRYTSILVTKDISAVGGSQGVTMSVIDQGYSSIEGHGVPEPASIALLGIGMTGFLAFRRFFKKASAA